MTHEQAAETPDVTTAPEAAPENRSRLVDAALRNWTRDLIDLGPRNQLLYYRDLAVGTLDLASADPASVTALVEGRRTQLSDLFVGDALVTARKRARAIHAKILEMQEERGISVGYLALGMATWEDQRDRKATRPPAAPVLLRRITLEPRTAAGDDYTLEVNEDVEVNPVLIHLLETQFSGSVATEGSSPIGPAEPTGPDVSVATSSYTTWAAGIADADPTDPAGAYEQLASMCAHLPGFGIEHRTVVGTFSYAKLPMVNDLKRGRELLAAHDIVAALAGDRDSQAAIRGLGGTEVDPTAPDHTPPTDEFIVLDADSSQSYAINAVVSGNNLVIKGPPGTGKSQTISNLISSLVARGQKVLFVAEKRAAIDAVVSRLGDAGLDQWVMDLHDGAGNRRRTAQSLAASLDRAAATPRPALEALHRDLVGARDRLLAHEQAMHEARHPWGVSMFDAQARLLGLQTTVGGQRGRALKFRLSGQHLDRATEQAVARLRDATAEYADLGGLSAIAATSPWHGAPITNPQQTQAAFLAVTQLRDTTLPRCWTTLEATATDAGLPFAPTLNSWADPLTLLSRTAAVLEKLRPETFDLALPELIAATGSRHFRKQAGIAQSWGERRKLRKQAESLCALTTPSTSVVHDWLIEAAAVRETWAQVTEARPRVPERLADAEAAYAAALDDATAVRAFLAPGAPDLSQYDRDGLHRALTALIDDRATLQLLPRRNALENDLAEAGLGPMLAECRRATMMGSGDASEVPTVITANQARDLVEAVWLASVVDHIGFADPTYGSFSGATQSRVADDFRKFDTKHVATAAARVQRICAERLYAELDAHPDQATLIRGEANKKTRHKPMRDLLALAPDVLLAAKPCWAMSPLVVSHTLPMQELFDIVIFDEASQIPPADAIPSIVRGRRVAVAGDERQLPPTAFFASSTPETEDDTESTTTEVDGLTVAVTSGYESVLDSLATIIPFRSLAWHYRSQDERLIAFSNAHIYDSSLTTFPGAHAGDVLTHVPVDTTSGLDAAAAGTSSAEVARVADLVIDHARNRPQESLGVITMGIKHAQAIDEAVRIRVRENRDLLSFFDESRHERFFVKNLERVQGDERDAIILSVGYGKNADGRPLYRFGPLNLDGGERRLNVAVSRAKRRLTLVSVYRSSDLDPNRLNARGAQLLGAFIGFMESGGTDLGSFTPTPPALNPFEIDVRDRLNRAGIPLVAQHGVSGYRIDFAAQHPTQPGRMVLAIEADGASYHSSTTARDRDRLRQEHLERLGWRFHRIWSTDWFRDPDTEVAKALTAYEAAVRAADSTAKVARDVVSPPAPLRDGISPNAVAEVVEKSPARLGPRPAIQPGQKITEYASHELTALIRWIESDGLLRTEEELLRAAMHELGLTRKGAIIATTLSGAIRDARKP